MDEVFWQMIEKYPREPLHKLALADFLEERGVEEGTQMALRWCAEHGFNPGINDFRNIWVWAPNVTERYGYPEIPQPVQDQLVQLVSQNKIRHPDDTWDFPFAFKRLGMVLMETPEPIVFSKVVDAK